MTRVTEAYIFASTVRHLGLVSFDTASINNAAVMAAANISADKLINRQAISYVQDGTVVNATKLLHLCRAAGTIKSVEVRPLTAPTGGDLAFTVDIQKAADGSGSFSTLLASVETVDNSSVDQTRQQVTLVASPALVDGDAIEVIVAVSGSTGTQGIGVIVTVNIDENGG